MAKLGAFTIVMKDENYLRLWLDHYARQVEAPQQLFVLEHVLPELRPQHAALCADYGVNYLQINRPAVHDHVWMCQLAQTFQRWMLHFCEYVLYTDVDELLLHAKYQRLVDYLAVVGSKWPIIRSVGFEVVQHEQEAPLPEYRVGSVDAVFARRRYWAPSFQYSKTLLARVPLTWTVGFHSTVEVATKQDLDLLLLHTHRVDKAWALAKHMERAGEQWSAFDKGQGMASHNAIVDAEKFEAWFKINLDTDLPLTLERIPPHVRQQLGVTDGEADGS